MKNKLTYFISILLSSLLGAGIMYTALYFLPINKESEKASTSEKLVTVTDNGISEGIDKIYNAVVVVENYQRNSLAGIGSGFIYSEEGYIMTNHHVVEDASEIKVVLSNGETLDATVIGSDEFADIAVIQIDKSHVTSVAKIGSSENAKLGDTVFTIGSPMDIDYLGTVTRGILSGKDRMVEVQVSSTTNDWIMNVMQTDAAINPGNSGGPLCNVNGEVIGINTMKIVENEIEGIGFAIPIEDAVNYANKIVNKEEIQRSYLGVSMAEISTPTYYLRREGITLDDSITSGVIVLESTAGGPANKAGIEKGDVIVKIGDNEVTNVARLRYYLYKHEPNEIVEITVIRGKEHKVFNVELGKSD